MQGDRTAPAGGFDLAEVRRQLAQKHQRWSVEWREECHSTSAVLIEQARAGAADRSVLVAARQTEGGSGATAVQLTAVPREIALHDRFAVAGTGFHGEADGNRVRLSGKRAARRFLDEHFDQIGVKSTVDLQAEAQAEWA